MREIANEAMGWSSKERQLLRPWVKNDSWEFRPIGAEMSAQIFVVATPLGNREDLSPRAQRILQTADLIACEDTRRTGQLLRSLEIVHAQLVSYYDAIEGKRAEDLITRVQSEQLSLALVSDAGTPAIADPGFRLVKRAHELGIPVRVIPGPSTLSALVSVAGLPSDRILFVGFLPRKKNQLIAEIATWKQSLASIVAFESPLRLQDSLAVLAEQLPNAEICIGRELTKLYEEVQTSSIAQAVQWAKAHTHLKGELALMIHTATTEEEKADVEWEPLLRKAQFLLERGLSHKDIVACLGDEHIDRKELYRRLLELKNKL